jgi:hypothetical protein
MLEYTVVARNAQLVFVQQNEARRTIPTLVTILAVV